MKKEPTLTEEELYRKKIRDEFDRLVKLTTEQPRHIIEKAAQQNSTNSLA